MPLEVFANNPSATVASGGTAAPAAGTAETWTVSSSASFPAVLAGATGFHVADPAQPSEMIAVTAVSGTTWTVTRGAESSVPVPHQAGFTVVQVATAGALAALQYQPYQFPVARYGATGNGRVVYDGSITSGASALTTPGLAAPATPAVANAGTGGTVLAGTYQVKITYVNGFGETVASASASTTTTGSTSTITITGPSAWGNGAVGWYAYVTQAGGSTYTRQQPAGFPSSPTPLAAATQLVLTAPPTSSGPQPPAANTTMSNPFTAADVGKAVMVIGCGPAGQTTQAGTITAYTSSSAVTVSFTASATAGPCQVWWAADDTAAFQNAIAAATSYASAVPAGNGYAEIVIPPPPGAFYGIAGPLVTGTPTFGNSQITLPVIQFGANKITLAFRSGASGVGWMHWEQTAASLSGSNIVCMAQPFASSTAQGNSINASGNPAIIGGPAQPAGYGAGPVNGQVQFANLYVILDGLRFITPYSGNGWQYCGADFSGIAQAKITDCTFDTTATVETTWNTASNITSLSNGSSVGFLMPANANNDTCYLTNVSVGGGYRRGMLLTEHTDGFGLRVLYCYAALAISGSYFGSVGASHAFNVGRVSIESCNNLMEILGSGQSGIGPIVGIGQLDTESASPAFIDDGSSGILNAQGIIGLTGLFTVSGITIGPTALQLINWQQKPGVVTPPSVPATATPIKNTFWRWATVTLNGGTAITQVALGVTSGGTTAPSMTAVFTQSSAALASVTVRVPPGGWISWTGTGTAPTWFWMLD